MLDINTYKNYYFVGIGGIGMSALSRYFASIGKNISGYDKTNTKLTDELQSEGIKINFRDEVTSLETNLSSNDTLIIFTPAIKKLNILNFFEKKEFKIIKRAKALGEITRTSRCIAVAGTHGKTTTSTLIPFSGFLGGISQNYNSNFIYNGSEFSVVEADEYDRSFMNLSPEFAVITSMDADHLDIYENKNNIEKTFKDFALKISNNKKLFVRKGLNIDREVVTYAVNEIADYYSDNIRIEDDVIRFDFHPKDEDLQYFEWNLQGIHNVENATVAISVVRNLGASWEDLKKGIKSFEGIKRRYTKHNFDDGRIYIDDYAHHPTELNSVIESIRTFYPNKKLLVVFQPHLFSRTRDFLDDFADALSRADELILLDIYPARELPIEGVTSDVLLKKINCENKEVSSLSDALENIKTKDFDILLTVGAGDIDRLYEPILEWMNCK